MLDEGLLDLPPLPDGSPSPVTAAFAIHTTSSMPTGFISTKSGPVMASADTLRITVTGRGGHASEPFRDHRPDPDRLRDRAGHPDDGDSPDQHLRPGVVTIGRISAGTTDNVIPETAEIEGTIRAVSESTRQKIHDGLRRVAEGVAAAHEATVDVEVTRRYPVTVNADDFTSFAAGVADELLGANHVIRMPTPIMGAEDFSYVLQKVPGSMVFLGATPRDQNPAAAAPNHSNRVFFEEECMRTGIALHTAVALRHLCVA